MEKIYCISCYSKLRILITLLISLFSVFILTILIGPTNIWKQIIIFIWMILSGGLALFILPKYVAKSILQITNDKEDFKFDWIKPYWKGKTKPTIEFNLHELKSYKFESTNNFYTMKLRLNSGKKIVLHSYRIESLRDFLSFNIHFESVLKNYNKKKSTVVIIEREKSLMENRLFLMIIGCIIVLLIVLFILALIFKGVSNPKGFLIIFIVLGPFIWVVSQVIKGLKRQQ